MWGGGVNTRGRGLSCNMPEPGSGSLVPGHASVSVQGFGDLGFRDFRFRDLGFRDLGSRI